MAAQNSRPYRTRGIIMVLVASTLWGLSGTAAQVLFQHDHFQPGWLVTVRMLFSGAILVLWGLLRQDPTVRKLPLDRRMWLRLLIFAVVGLLAVQLSYFKAIADGNAASATLLQYLGPPMIVAYIALRHRKLPSRMASFAMILALFGTLLLVTGGQFDQLLVPGRALFWGVISALGLAFYTLQPISMLKQYQSVSVVGWGMLIGGIASLANSPIWRIPVPSITFSDWLLIAFVVLLGTLAAFSLYLASLRYLEPSETGLLATAEPVAAVLVSMLFLNVRLNVLQGIGAICILLAIVQLSRGSRSSGNSQGN